MSIQIITDSASDILPQQAEQLGVIVVPLTTHFGTEEYFDGVTITHEEFYQKLQACAELPTTSQVPPGRFEKIFEEVTKAGDSAVVICLSGKLSGTVQSARIAAQQFSDNIFVLDSECVTSSQQILVQYAVRLRDKGCSVQALYQELQSTAKRACLLGVVDSLEHLKRGGRISAATAIVGGLLAVKPVLALENGEIITLGKARGLKQRNNFLSEMIQQKGGIDFSLPLLVGYSGTDDSLMKQYLEDSAYLWQDGIDRVPVHSIGSTIGTHVGPGAITVAFFSKQQ